MDDDLFDLLEAIESGEASNAQIDDAALKASAMSNEDMLNVDVFAGDESDVVMGRSVVKGRADYVDHYSGKPILRGFRQLVLREVCEGEFITTRHSELSVWMMLNGFDPSCLKEPKP